MDSIVADDIGAFPDRNINEAASRVRGAARDNAAVEDVIIVGTRATTPRTASARTIDTEVAEWNPDRPYIKALAAAPGGRFQAVFDEQQKAHGGLPAFYFDVAELHFQRGRKSDAAAMALNVLELPTANTSTLAILADKLMRYGDQTRAIWVYEKILALEPDRPQPRRNLALALIQRSETAGAAPRDQRRDLERAMNLLAEVVLTPWIDDYDGVEIVALMEANRIVPHLKRLGVTDLPLDPRLIAPLPVDLRVVLEWNTDETDMNLWVDEPSGERVMFSSPQSIAGGRLSNDMTDGYGPEEYLLRRARPGRYQIRADVYDIDSFNPNGATTVRVTLYKDWGRPTQTVQTMEVELAADQEDEVLVGEFRVAAPNTR